MEAYQFEFYDEVISLPRNRGILKRKKLTAIDKSSKVYLKVYWTWKQIIFLSTQTIHATKNKYRWSFFQRYDKNAKEVIACRLLDDLQDESVSMNVRQFLVRWYL